MSRIQNTLHQTVDLNLTEAEPSYTVYVKVAETCGAFAMVIAADDSSDTSALGDVTTNRAFELGYDNSEKNFILQNAYSKESDDADDQNTIPVVDGETIPLIVEQIIAGAEGNIVYSLDLSQKLCDFVKVVVNRDSEDFVGELRVLRL